MLKLENVRCGYGSREILHGISFDFASGSNYCILGPNGCGKTTLIRAISALLPSTGSITVDGQEVRQLKRTELAKKMAVMSQVNSVYFSYSVLDTVLLGRYRQTKSRLFGGLNAEDRQAAEDCLRSVGLWELRDRSIDALSGGQRQRVFLAQTLAQDPEIILLDEPTNHLDIKHQVALTSYLKQWSADGRHMVIGVFHDINLALTLTDNVLFLRDGTLVRAGKFGDIADPAFLNTLYDTDITGYMRESFERWRSL